jgi:putative hydrolases of HD superfamily
MTQNPTAPFPPSHRLSQQIQFIVEIDKLKTVLRQTLLTDSSRRENSAEHSWHIALMAMILAEYAPGPIAVLRVMKMLLLHDLVEIDAGDTFCYDTQGNMDKSDREQQAADRLFGLLPPDQAAEFRALWEEFEARTTPDAQFAASLDRLQPVLHNQQTQGGTWQQYGITRDRVAHRLEPMKQGAPPLWHYIQSVLDDCVAAGYLQADDVKH